MMGKPAAPERDRVQEQPPQVPPGWAEAQQSLAAASGLSILLVEGHQPPALLVSNNNSICQALQSSPAHAHLCEPYCGKAYERAMSTAASKTHYRCHAGLHCFAMPVEAVKGRKLAVIGGRAFLTSVDYSALVERLRDGDLKDLLSNGLFRNVIFAARQDLDDLARRMAETQPPDEPGARADAADVIKTTPESVHPMTERVSLLNQKIGSSVESLERRSAPPDHPFGEDGGALLQAFAEKHGISSIALLLNDGTGFVTSFASGRFQKDPVRLAIGLDDARLTLTARSGTSLALSRGAEGFKPLRTIVGQGSRGQERAAELFPLVVGDEVKGAVLIGDVTLSDEKRKEVLRFCREMALPLEILRLRTELEQRARFTDSLQNFTERINAVEPKETYSSILHLSSELLRSERASLLLFDEASNELAVKGAIGPRASIVNEMRLRFGEGISGAVLSCGQPLVVRDLEEEGHQPAPAEHGYQTKSFISYPIIIGDRKVGVLNVTDKAGGGTYDEADLHLIEIIAPQIALALDRAGWHEKAAQFQLMSITDPLTGLLNRRYLEERLTEEVNRSQRYGYEMSFMMIDIDDFKLYNDRNGHQAGDHALEITAQCLKSALRSADVASRYGGEEFCILLPQTTLSEATAIAERIRRRVGRARYPYGKAQPLGAVTISIGISAYGLALETAAAIIGAADRALYLAKSQGKDRVCTHLESAPTGISKSDAAED
ncbi:MAG TPA: diguanylate cyclase [Pyrinomonadaceae bacterium]|nr:diguanylate cyclase [Pyrinomonadaceae bacterium]